MKYRNRSSWRVSCASALALAAALGFAANASSAAPKSAAATSDPAALEKAFDAELDNAEMGRWLEQMSSAPNQVGSPHDKANAEWMLAQFKSWGWDAHIEEFQVLYPTPVSETVELVGPEHFTATLQERAVDGDRTSGNTSGALPAYVAYQGDGDVTAELVYVNYGMPDDYKALERRGISVKGKIVIARYGQGWRGLKPKLAQEHGAVGCLIYSDPRDDGYWDDDVWPKRGQRPAQGIQRGSVQDMTIHPGDPLTPGWGATKDAKRIKREDAETILKIPALPISYGDAQHLLAAIGGPIAPASFRGALPITYHVGPGPAVVHLKVQSEWSLKTLYDTVAIIKGSQYPDQWVLRGNHHDAWVFGASDPLSGNVVEMAEAKAIGALVKQGWRPKRTLVYLGWDGEEPGLLGSTEWAETHADEIRRKGVLYLNTDSNGRGTLSAEGSNSWQHLVNEAARSVSDPETGATVYERTRATAEVEGAAPGAGERAKKLAKIAEKGGDLPLGPLGSGSDYSSFLQHVGIAALNIGFNGEEESGGSYHSVYDSFDHYSRIDNPGFKYEKTLAQIDGRIVLRAADAAVQPERFGDFAETVAGYGQELKQLLSRERETTETETRLIKSHAYELASNPDYPEGPPALEDAVPQLDFTALDKASERLNASAKAYDEAFAAKGARLSPATQAKLSDLLRSLDQTLLSEDGLPRRPWYKNMVWAPGVLTGYGAKTLPAVREAIEGRRWDEAQRYIGVTAGVIEAYAARLDQARALIGS
jgi:N-acetylated-alpha-linked acidic dipeptidase